VAENVRVKPHLGHVVSVIPSWQTPIINPKNNKNNNNNFEQYNHKSIVLLDSSIVELGILKLNFKF
jgi:hypothetical protein